MRIDPSECAVLDVYKVLIGSVVPRPIAFVSTISPEGVLNLAPFSFFNAVCADPPMIVFATGNKRGGLPKDTLRNIQQTGEFVVNIVSETIAEAMNLTSGEYPPEIDEFQVSGLTPIPSERIRPPRVGESPVQMECRLHQLVTLSERPRGGSLIIGEVVLIHAADEVLDGFKVDPAALRAVARMGGDAYCRTTDRFELPRPVVK